MAVQKLFGTNGIRGDAEKLFTNQFCFDIGRVFSIFLSQKKIKNKKIAFAMDSRASSRRIKMAVIAGIAPQYEILDEGIIPTPALNYFVKIKDCAGIMVSGSHIEEKLNGLKFFVGPEEISKKDEVIIENIYDKEKERIPYSQMEKRVFQENEAKNLYIKMLIGLAEEPFSGFKVVVDAGNGTQSETIPQALEKLKIKVIRINCDLRKPIICRDTETEGAFSGLQKEVLKQQANFGLGVDADGDRAIFVDEKGFSLPGEVSCSIIAKYSPAQTIVTPINTSSVVEHIGKKVVRTKVGVLYVVEAMKKNNSLVGFESNGGFVSGEIFYGRDAGSATIKMLNIMKKTGKKLSQLVDELPKFYIIKEKTDCPRRFNKLIFAKVKEKYKGKRTEDLDGLKVWADAESWILFRPSGNAPEFRVFAEAKAKEKAEKLVKEGMEVVNETIYPKSN